MTRDQPHPIPDWWQTDHEMATYLIATFGSLEAAAQALDTQPPQTTPDHPEDPEPDTP